MKSEGGGGAVDRGGPPGAEKSGRDLDEEGKGLAWPSTALLWPRHHLSSQESTSRPRCKGTATHVWPGTHLQE